MQRALGGAVVARVQRRAQGLGRVRGRADHDPAAEGIRHRPAGDVEMGIVAGERMDRPPAVQQRIQQIASLASGGVDGGGLVADLDRMGPGDRRGIPGRKPLPLGMHQREEGAGVRAAAGQGRGRLVRRGRGEAAGRPTARRCQISPGAVAGACTSAPRSSVSPAGASSAGSVSGKPQTSRKWSERQRKSWPAKA